MRAWTRVRTMFFDSLLIIAFFLPSANATMSARLWPRSFDSPRSLQSRRLAHARKTPSLRSGLSDLLLQALADVAHTFVLVRIRRTQRTHLRRHLPDFLPVDARKREARLLRVHRNLHAGRQRILDRMRVAQREHHRALALHLGAIADAD